MNVQRIDHLVIAVQDMEAAAAAWAQTFGLKAEPAYQPAGTHMELALLPVGEGAFLELVRPTTEEHRVARHIAERGEGLFSISLQVDDLDAAVRELREKGATVSDPEPGVLPDTRIARIPRDSAHGVAVQLIERANSS